MTNILRHTSFETTSGLYIYNQPQNVALSVVDQIGIPGTITNISFVGVTGGYATGSSDFTFGADFPQGAYDLIVTVGENTFRKGFGFLTATPSTTDVPTIDDASSYVIFSAEKMKNMMYIIRIMGIIRALLKTSPLIHIQQLVLRK